MRGSKRASSRHAMEWASGWFKILAATARERPGAAAAAGIGAAAALPAALVVMVTAFAVASALFCLLALPLGAATAAWWLATGREMPSLSHHIRRDRANDSVLSSVSEVSVEADDVVAAGDRPADLILVHAGQREYAMEGCDNAARMVAERIAATVEHTTTRAVSVVDIAVLCSVGADEMARAFRPGGSRARLRGRERRVHRGPLGRAPQVPKGARRVRRRPPRRRARRRRRRVALRRARGR